MPAAGRDPGDAADVVLSTIVLNWNRFDLLTVTLRSYLDTVSVPHQLIVVDNASTDGSRDIINDLCADHPNRRAILLPENLGGDAINEALPHCRGRFIQVSENDIEFLPGWDRSLLGKFDVFPKLGQISPFSPFHRSEEGEVWSDKPATPWTLDGLTIHVAERGVGTSCIVPREIYDRGARWTTKGEGRFRFPRDGRFSASVKNLGFVVAWNDVYVVKNLGHNIEEFVNRLPYYLENYRAKPGKGVEVFARRLDEHGYRLAQDAAGAWTVQRRPADD